MKQLNKKIKMLFEDMTLHVIVLSTHIGTGWAFVGLLTSMHKHMILKILVSVTPFEYSATGWTDSLMSIHRQEGVWALKEANCS